ncbi:MAG: hypothetical protein KAR06_11155 [Deltaproteobacteria bacterium]|nr:hypothetical protein [Deltaproteobacteria bacterium]
MSWKDKIKAARECDPVIIDKWANRIFWTALTIFFAGLLALAAIIGWIGFHIATGYQYLNLGI